jgi:hypothetical protein
LREAATKKTVLLKIVEKIVLPLRLSTIISDTRIILTICMDRIRHHACETTSMLLYNMGDDDNHSATQSILNELQILYHASILLKKKLATVKGLKVPWLPVAE